MAKKKNLKALQDRAADVRSRRRREAAKFFNDFDGSCFVRLQEEKIMRKIIWVDWL
jgi:hypothetical protein